MTPKANLVSEQTQIMSGLDSVVIRQYNGGITGGRTLDMTGFDFSRVEAGHVAIKVLDEDGKNYTYKPMPVKDGGYDEMPEGHKVAGVVVASKPADYPLVGIMDDGRVNDEAMPYPLTEELKTLFKSDLPNLIFEHD